MINAFEKQPPSPFINRVDDYGYTALHYAVANGHSGIVNELMNRGADPTGSTKSGKTIFELIDARFDLVDASKNLDVTTTRRLRLYRDSYAQSNSSSLLFATTSRGDQGIPPNGISSSLATEENNPPECVTIEEGDREVFKSYRKLRRW